MHTRKKLIDSLKYSGFALLAILVATGLSFGLDALNISPEAILLVYLLPILAIAIVCPSYVYSMVSSIAILCLFNFCFTAPRYSFAIDNPELYISLAMYLLVSTLLFLETRGAHHEIEKRKENEKRLYLLSDFSSFLLEEREEKEILARLWEHLNSYFAFPIYVVSQDEKASYLDNHQSEGPLCEAVSYSFASSLPSGNGESHASFLPYKIIPLASGNKTYALLLFAWSNKKAMGEFDASFVTSLSSLASNALAKKEAIEASEKSRLFAENEHFKTTLLRSLSHDIKTPLTALETGTSLLSSSYHDLSESDRLSIAKNLSEEAHALSEYVENLLSLSKIASLTSDLPKSYELASDLWEEAYEREKSIFARHHLQLEVSDNLLVRCDGRLVVEVLGNLLHNALTHTRSDCDIFLSAAFDKGQAVFKVIDNGGGIPSAKLDHLFDEFSPETPLASDRYQGHGLGLSICQSIVKVHQGSIKAYNNELGGATFLVTLPEAKIGEKHDE